MYTCVFFGHRRYAYTEYRERIKAAIVALIEERSVTNFFSGNRGEFDRICVSIVNELKENYPNLRLTQVFSYVPQGKSSCDDEIFDDSVYLLERAVPPRYAIIETNKKMVERADYVLSGVMYDWGGAATAITYALKKQKTVIDLFGVFI